MVTSYNKPDFLDKAEKKLKELIEALDVIQKVEDQIAWAHDFASFVCISNALQPIFCSLDSARDDLEREYYYLDEQISDFNYKKLEFETENEIKT